MDRKIRRCGFTIIELLVVISIMAVIATLATGAAIKSVKQSRKKRIDVTARALETALVSYRALNGEWPYRFDNPDAKPSCMNEDSAIYTQTETFGTYSHVPHSGCPGVRARHEAKDNAEVFKKVFSEIKNGRALLDTSSILTSVRDGGRMTVREAMERGKTDIPVGYPNPDNQSDFFYFKVTYNFKTDSITVGKDK